MPASVFDDLGRPFVDDLTKKAIYDAFKTVDPGKRGALLIRADMEGNAIAQVAAKLGKNGEWKVAGGTAFKFGEKRPVGWVAIERSW